jgi:ParB/RepB/Spo0J family partition protein
VLIDGERRWRAAAMIGMTTLAAIVDGRALTPDQVLETQIVENALRQDLTQLEAGAAYRVLMRHWNCTQQQLAERLHVSQSKVSRALAALDLPAAVQEEIRGGKTAATAAVKTAARNAGRRAARKPSHSPAAGAGAAVQIDTDAGLVVVTVKPGHTVDDALAAAVAKRRSAAAAA